MDHEFARRRAVIPKPAEVLWLFLIRPFVMLERNTPPNTRARKTI